MDCSRGTKVGLHCVKMWRTVEQRRLRHTWTWSSTKGHSMDWNNLQNTHQETGTKNRSLYPNDPLQASPPKQKGQFGKSTSVSSVDGTWTLLYQLWIHILVEVESGNLCRTIIYSSSKWPTSQTAHEPLRSLKLGHNISGTYFLSSLPIPCDFPPPHCGLHLWR